MIKIPNQGVRKLHTDECSTTKQQETLQLPPKRVSVPCEGNRDWILRPQGQDNGVTVSFPNAADFILTFTSFKIPLTIIARKACVCFQELIEITSGGEMLLLPGTQLTSHKCT